MVLGKFLVDFVSFHLNSFQFLHDFLDGLFFMLIISFSFIREFILICQFAKIISIFTLICLCNCKLQVELLLGKAYSDWGHVSDAVAVYDQLISSHPDDFRGYLAKVFHFSPLYMQSIS